ncbi:MAG: hypothetical protein JNJ46_07305 [Myxococcales bacterium]|nr:hypothetical protein [Myxococcales bacterium]
MISNLHSSVLVSASLILHLSLPARAGTNDKTKPGSASTPQPQPAQTGVGVAPRDTELDVLDIQVANGINTFDYYTRCTGITSATPNEYCAISTADSNRLAQNNPLCNCAITQINWLAKQLNKPGVLTLGILQNEFQISVTSMQVLTPSKGQGTQERIVIKLPNAIFKPSMKGQSNAIVAKSIITIDSGGTLKVCYKSILECLNKDTAFTPSSTESKQPQQSPPRH